MPCPCRMNFSGDAQTGPSRRKRDGRRIQMKRKAKSQHCTPNIRTLRNRCQKSNQREARSGSHFMGDWLGPAFLLQDAQPLVPWRYPASADRWIVNGAYFVLRCAHLWPGGRPSVPRPPQALSGVALAHPCLAIKTNQTSGWNMNGDLAPFQDPGRCTKSKPSAARRLRSWQT